ncbi:hypothetical protein RR46_02329 [Papilio xuthus]|uniref:Uncharacterized protein n=1 Tax=Papilio xuthus TaxID=66420 RepID=A0A194Q0K4_PAPXU|nr:hypothetical protein RR46_02329 [Papilio xuthus]
MTTLKELSRQKSTKGIFFFTFVLRIWHLLEERHCAGVLALVISRLSILIVTNMLASTYSIAVRLMIYCGLWRVILIFSFNIISLATLALIPRPQEKVPVNPQCNGNTMESVNLEKNQ